MREKKRYGFMRMEGRRLSVYRLQGGDTDGTLGIMIFQHVTHCDGYSIVPFPGHAETIDADEGNLAPIHLHPETSFTHHLPNLHRVVPVSERVERKIHSRSVSMESVFGRRNSVIVSSHPPF